MKIRDLCLDVIAYFAIAILLIIGGVSEWKANNKFASILSFIVAGFMTWEGIENYMNNCKKTS